MDSFKDIIAAWPSRAHLAADTGAADAGVVKQWHLRDSIPAPRWPSLIAAARRRGIAGVTFERLAELAASRRARTPRSAA